MDRLRRSESPPSEGPPTEGQPHPVTPAAPGLTAFFAGVPEDGRETLLDLGTAAAAKLRMYGRYARRIRFADVLAPDAPDRPLGATLAALMERPGHPYGLVLGWNILDRVPADQRRLVVDAVADLTVSGARLHLLVGMTEETVARPLHFTLLDDGRLAHEALECSVPMSAPLLPAEVDRVLAPFRIVNAFILRSGMREYVAVRR